jgi:hypothetical protein
LLFRIYIGFLEVFAGWNFGSPGPFWLRFAGGTGGMWLCFDIRYPHWLQSLTGRSGFELREAGRVAWPALKGLHCHWAGRCWFSFWHPEHGE